MEKRLRNKIQHSAFKNDQCIQHMEYRNQSGSAVTGLLLALVFIFYFVLVPYSNQKIVEEHKVNGMPVTIDDKIHIASFEEKDEPSLIPTGKYYTEREIDGKAISGTYYFDNKGMITKEVVIIGEYKLSGVAKYHFEGSVMKFSYVSGDKGLFPSIGEAISIPDKHTLISHGTENTFEFKLASNLEN